MGKCKKCAAPQFCRIVFLILQRHTFFAGFQANQEIFSYGKLKLLSYGKVKTSKVFSEDSGELSIVENPVSGGFQKYFREDSGEFS